MTYAERRSQFQMQALELELFAIEGRFRPSAFVGWNATPDVAQATWEWPPKPIGPGYAITVLQRQDERKAVWLGGYDFEGGYLTVP